LEKEIILESKYMNKTFGPTHAVCDVSVDIYKGEIRTIIGENGSGKSTYCNMLAGYLRRDSGEITFDGRPYCPRNPMEAARAGISMIMQEMGTIEGLSVAENIFLGHEDEFIHRGIRDKAGMNAAAKKLLEQYNMGHIDPDADVSAYKFEERKMMEIVKAMYMDPKILIIDETTTALSQKGRNELYELIKDLRSRGRSIIFISHDMEEILSLSDTITVFRDGHHIGTFDNDDHINEEKLKLLMVGRELNGRYYRDDYDGELSQQTVLEAKGLCMGTALKDVSLTLRKGEILGIGGLTESGMHDLGKALCGANKIDSGEVTVTAGGKKIQNLEQSIAAGVGYVSKNRDQEALILYSSIQENISLSSMDLLKHGPVLLRRQEREYAQAAAERMAVKMSSIDAFVTSLSGGNKQKVALAKWIARDSDILILDCPTRGIDVMVKASIYDLMDQLRREGKSIILISEEILELIGMCDRILVLKDGCITGELNRSRELSDQDLIRYMV